MMHGLPTGLSSQKLTAIFILIIKGSTLAGITMTESQLTYFIKKDGTVEKGDGKKFLNTNLRSILKKVYEYLKAK